MWGTPNGGSVGNGHGRWDPRSASAPGDWVPGDRFVFGPLLNVHGAQCRGSPPSIYKKHPNSGCFSRNELGTFRLVSVSDCRARCDADSACVSFEYHTAIHALAPRLCQLSTSCLPSIMDVGQSMNIDLYVKLNKTRQSMFVPLIENKSNDVAAAPYSTDPVWHNLLSNGDFEETDEDDSWRVFKEAIINTVVDSDVCPAGMYHRLSKTDSLVEGGVGCGCKSRWLNNIDSGNGLCSSSCSTCACCCSAAPAFIKAYDTVDQTYALCLPVLVKANEITANLSRVLLVESDIMAGREQTNIAVRTGELYQMRFSANLEYLACVDTEISHPAYVQIFSWPQRDIISNIQIPKKPLGEWKDFHVIFVPPIDVTTIGVGLYVSHPKCKVRVTFDNALLWPCTALPIVLSPTAPKFLSSTFKCKHSINNSISKSRVPRCTIGTSGIFCACGVGSKSVVCAPGEYCFPSGSCSGVTDSGLILNVNPPAFEILEFPPSENFGISKNVVPLKVQIVARIGLSPRTLQSYFHETVDTVRVECHIAESASTILQFADHQEQKTVGAGPTKVVRAEQELSLHSGNNEVAALGKPIIGLCDFDNSNTVAHRQGKVICQVEGFEGGPDMTEILPAKTIRLSVRNVAFPAWSDAVLIQEGRTLLPVPRGSVTTIGAQNFSLIMQSFGPNSIAWVGPMFGSDTVVTINGIRLKVHTSEDHMSTSFLVPSFEDACKNDNLGDAVTNASCPGALPLIIENTNSGAWFASTIYFTELCHEAGGWPDPTVEADTCLSFDADEAVTCAYGSRSDCRRCPRNARCPGGFRAWPMPGHWSSGEASLNVVRCAAPAIKRCRGFNTTLGRSECGTGYEGNACGGCIARYFRDRDAQCVPCPKESDDAGFSPILATALYIGIFFLSVFAALSCITFMVIGLGVLLVTKRNQSGHLSSPRSAKQFCEIALKKSLDFSLQVVVLIQVVGIAMRPIPPSTPGFMRPVVSVIEILLFDSSGIVHPECTGDDVFVADKLVLGGTLFVLSFTLVLQNRALRPEACCASSPLGKLCQAKITPQIRRLGYYFLGMLYGIASSTALEFLTCVPGSENVEYMKNDEEKVMVYRLRSDMNYRCYDDRDGTMSASVLSWIVMVCFVVPWPLVSFLYVRHHFFTRYITSKYDKDRADSRSPLKELACFAFPDIMGAGKRDDSTGASVRADNSSEANAVNTTGTVDAALALNEVVAAAPSSFSSSSKKRISRYDSNSDHEILRKGRRPQLKTVVFDFWVGPEQLLKKSMFWVRSVDMLLLFSLSFIHAVFDPLTFEGNIGAFIGSSLVITIMIVFILRMRPYRKEFFWVIYFRVSCLCISMLNGSLLKLLGSDLVISQDDDSKRAIEIVAFTSIGLMVLTLFVSVIAFEWSILQEILLWGSLQQSHGDSTYGEPATHNSRDRSNAYFKALDDASGKTYYVHAVSLESIWVLPAGARVVENDDVCTFNNEDAARIVGVTNPMAVLDLHHHEKESFQKEYDDATASFQKEYDHTTGEHYYVNTDTGEAVWELPESFVGITNPMSVHDLHHERASFQKEYDHTTGEHYYVNTDTGEAVWELPESFKREVGPASDRQHTVSPNHATSIPGELADRVAALSETTDEFFAEYDESTDAEYYIHTQTGKSVWTLPAGAKVVGREGAEFTKNPLGVSNQKEKKKASSRSKSYFYCEYDESSGEYYYVNSDTGDSVWKLPPGGELLDKNETVNLKATRINQDKSKDHWDSLTPELEPIFLFRRLISDKSHNVPE